MRNKSNFLDCIKTTPVIQAVCQKTGVSRATYYRWRKEDVEFKKRSDIAMKKGVHFINDMAESQLISQIKNSNMTAIIFWLKNHHKTYSENKIYLSQDEQEKLSRLLNSIDMNDFYQTIIKKLANGEISKSTASLLPSIIRKINLIKRETNRPDDSEAMKLLEKILNNGLEENNLTGS